MTEKSPASTPLSRSRKALEGVDIRRLLENSGIQIEIATAIADQCEGLLSETGTPLDFGYWYKVKYHDEVGRLFTKGELRDAFIVGQSARSAIERCAYPEECKKLGRCVRPGDHDSPPPCRGNPYGTAPSSTAPQEKP